MKFRFLLFSIFISFFLSCSKENTDEQFDNKDFKNESLVLNGSKLKSSYIELEPNNTIAQSNILPNSEVLISANTGTNEDWYKLSAIQGKVIHFFLNGNAPFIGGMIYNNGGIKVANFQYQQDFVFSPEYTGTYYIKLSGYSNINYTINVTFGINEVEPNNTFETANIPISSGNYFQGSTDASGSDYVKIKLINDGPITFYLKGSAAYVSAYLYNSSLVQIKDISNNQALTYYVLSAGTYYIKISGLPNISYSFYVDPLYSMVNSIYFLADPNTLPFKYVSWYKSSPVSFSSLRTVEKNWSNHGFASSVYLYINNEMDNDVHVFPFETYSNGFPKLFQDGLTGL